jgi:biotin transport system substrate-specific component
VVATLIGAGLTAVCAKFGFFLPGNPFVPVTMQVFAVVLCGMVLGSRLGAIAQMQYLVAGLLGAPVFATMKAGPLAVFGPTGGYLVGFVIAAYVTGLIVERFGRASAVSFCVAGLFGAALVHTCGVAWLSVWGGTAYHGFAAWAMGSASFMALDVVKVTAAAMLASKEQR